MDDLAAFCAALDEDEAAARAALAAPAIPQPGGGFVLRDYAGDRIPDAMAAHIARHDPARTLREVAVKRAILAEHPPVYPVTFPEPSGQPTCGVCQSGGMDWDPQDWPCATVRAVASGLQ